MDDTRTRAGDPLVSALIAVAVVGVVGCLLMAIAHAGVRIPLFSALGPGGDTVVPPAVGGFAVAAALYALVAMGVARRRAWAWAVGLVVGALTVLGAAMPFRGIGSVVGIVLGLATVGLLLAPPVRTALLPRR